MECKYRNCKNEITEGRIDKEYCCIQCKRNEKKYRQRLRKRLLKENEITNK